MSRKQFIDPKTHIIVALDTEDEKKAFNVMDQIYDQVDCIKLNYPLVLKEGLGIIERLKKRYDLPIFADFKVADVPVTNSRIVKLVANAGADAIMVHGIVGPDGIEDILKADANIAIVIQTEFTHPGGVLFTQRMADTLAELAKVTGCQAVQAPGNRPERIKKVKEIVGNDLKIVCCGVGAQGGNYWEVLEAGGDFPIIGRAIYENANPRQYILDILKEREIK